MCGNKIREEPPAFSTRRRIGYGSIYDSDIIELRLCATCLDELVKTCKISPLKQDTVRDPIGG